MTTRPRLAVFGIEHPFWQTAVNLRLQHWSAQMIVAAAREAGHRLTVNEVNYGLRHAPAELGLAEAAAYVMHRRHALTQPDFEALTTMRELVLEALSMIERIEDELGQPRLRRDRRIELEAEYEKWVTKAFSWAKQVAEVELGPTRGGGPPDTSPPARRGDVLRTIGRQLLGEMQAKLPAPPTDQYGLGAIYGVENVRPPDLTLAIDDDDDDGD